MKTRSDLAVFNNWILVLLFVYQAIATDYSDNIVRLLITKIFCRPLIGVNLLTYASVRFRENFNT